MTKTLRGFGLIGAITMASAGAWLACGDDTNGGAPADGGNDATGSSSSGGTASSSGSGSSSGTKGGSSSSGGSSGSSSSSSGSSSGSSSSGGRDAGDAGAAVSCATYCATIQSACTGANQQYAINTDDGGSDECLNACKYFGTADADTGNTLLCHNEHANNAKMAPIPHCWHAGPYGWGVCGNQCDDFCNLATQYCSPAGGFSADSGQPPYPSLSSCTMACAMFTMNGDDSGTAIVTDAGAAAANSYSTNDATAPTSGNTLDCREYHLGAALQSPSNQQVHCLHPGVNSPTCM